MTAIQTHSQHELTSSGSTSSPDKLAKPLWNPLPKRETITRGGVLAASQVKREKKRDCAEFLYESPISSQHSSARWWMDASPASALPLILSSSSGLNHWVSVTLLLSSSPLPLRHEHNHMCTYYTTSQGGCPQSRNRGLVLANSEL